MITCAGHLKDILSKPKLRSKAAKDTANMITRNCPSFEAIACRGVSGAIIASLVATYLDKPLIVVRATKTTHSDNMVEYGITPSRYYPVIRYVIVDDLIATGTTVKDILSRINEAYGSDMVPVGIALYENNSLYSKAYFNDTDTKTDIPIWQL